MKKWAWYNEIDPQKAAWLRELIAHGVIASGEVDERSIADVDPSELRDFTQCHFFAGIGVWSYALRLAGWPDDRPVWTGSCPCPSFSAAGKGKGFDDPRHLWPDWFQLIREFRPANIFGEQVAAAIGHGWLDLVSSDLEGADYAIGAAVLGACSVGAPHIRQRLYFCAYAEHAERWPEREIDGDTHGRNGFRGSGKPGRSPDSAGSRRQEAREHDGRQSLFAARSLESGGTGERAHSEPSAGSRIRKQCGAAVSNAETERIAVGCEHVRRHANASGATRGFWADCDWWYGKDGKYRPIEPGLFPLAYGTANRVLKLRGYGDAICPEVASEFIEAASGTQLVR